MYGMGISIKGMNVSETPINKTKLEWKQTRVVYLVVANARAFSRRTDG